jgi:hypothetical protein
MRRPANLHFRQQLYRDAEDISRMVGGRRISLE